MRRREDRPAHFEDRPSSYWRQKLLELDHGPTYLNGVAVRREPSGDGKWFWVGTVDSYPERFDQRLRLAHAIVRVKSGYMPWCIDKPPVRLRTCFVCRTDKRDRWAGAFSWCVRCVEWICLDCHNEHFDSCAEAR